jgi:hypothetical protein
MSQAIESAPVRPTLSPNWWWMPWRTGGALVQDCRAGDGRTIARAESAGRKLDPAQAEMILYWRGCPARQSFKEER